MLISGSLVDLLQQAIRLVTFHVQENVPRSSLSDEKFKFLYVPSIRLVLCTI